MIVLSGVLFANKRLQIFLSRRLFIFFFYVYLAMAGLGLALESMITLLTPRFVPFFLFTLVSPMICCG